MKERWQVKMNQGESQINSLVQKKCRMTEMFASFARKLQGIKIYFILSAPHQQVILCEWPSKEWKMTDFKLNCLLQLIPRMQ